MTWEVEYTDEFGACWMTLAEDERIDISAIVSLLEEKGPQLLFPFSSVIEGATYPHLRELRIQSNSSCAFYTLLIQDGQQSSSLEETNGETIGGTKLRSQRNCTRSILLN